MDTVVFAEDDGKNRHGFPRGYHYVPRGVELIRVLEDKLAGIPLLDPLPNIFHDVEILDYHPAELYEAYKADEEAGYIYFFSRRKFPGARRTRPVRATKDGNWTASGHGKLVTRGGVNVGCRQTMVFYHKMKKKSDSKTDWAMHEYTSINGPNKQVADLALYRLYNKKEKKKRKKNEAGTLSDGSPKKKRKKKKNEAGQLVRTLSNCSPKLEELPSPSPMAGGMSMPSTSQAQAQAGVEQPHDHYHQYVLAAVPSMPPSLQAAAVNYWPQQQATDTPMYPGPAVSNDIELADWDNTTLPSLSSLPAPSTVLGPAAVGHNMPTSQQQDAEYPRPAVSNEQLLKMLPPPSLSMTAAEESYLDDELKVLCEYPEPADSNDLLLKMLPLPTLPPAPDSGGYQLDDEFNLCCEMQEKQPAMSPCRFPKLDHDDLPMLTDEENQLYACTLDELLGQE